MALFIEIEHNGELILLNCLHISHVKKGEATTLIYLMPNNPLGVTYILSPKPYKTIKDEIL
jgi:hypothetical protein